MVTTTTWPPMTQMNYTTTLGPTTKPGPTSSSTIAPDGTVTYGKWIPYVVAATVIACVLIFAIFCCCRSFRDIFCCCCGKKRQTTEASSSFIVNRPNTETLINTVPSSAYKSGYKSQQSKSLPKSERVSVTSMNNSQLLDPYSRQATGRSGSSSQPMRHQVQATYKTQRAIGSILASGRRPPPQVHPFSPVPSTAPPAAKQVTRTAKIIGDILTYGGKRRK